MTSTNQKNMQTVLGNGKVSNVGLYKTGGNMVTEDWDADYVPDNWEDREEEQDGWEDQEMGEAGYSDEECFDDNETEKVQNSAHFLEARKVLLQNITDQTTRQVQEQQKQDVLDREAVKKVLNRVANETKTEDAMELDDHEYPELNASPTVKKQESKPGFEIVQTGGATWTEVKGKKGKQTFQLGAGSMIAERKKEKRQQFAKTNDVRDKAFALMENKEEMAKSLRKTTMCRSVGKTNANGTPAKCPYGDKCNFAHSLDELQIRMCKFEDRCRFIYTTPANEIRNRRGCKTCTSKHPNETDAGYFARTGICKIAKPRVVSPKPVVLPKFSKAGLVKEQARITTENKDKLTKDKQASGGTGWSHMMKRSAVKSSPSRSPSPVAKTPTEIDQGNFAVGDRSEADWVQRGVSVPGIVINAGLTKTQKKNTQRKKVRAATSTVLTSRSPSPVVAKKRKMSGGASSPSPTTLPEATVMKVPAEFMGQAIEMAMKMGKTNIKFECA